MPAIPPLVDVATEDGSVRFLDELPADADFIIVMPLTVPLAYPDNLIGQCSACGRAIQRRPLALPKGFPTLCMGCAPGWYEAMKAAH